MLPKQLPLENSGKKCYISIFLASLSAFIVRVITSRFLISTSAFDSVFLFYSDRSKLGLKSLCNGLRSYDNNTKARRYYSRKI